MDYIIRLKDKVESCIDCPCHNGESGYCQITKKSVIDEPPKSCPLIPVEDFGKKILDKLYPYMEVYDNGIFVEYNVVQKREGIVSTTCFGKNKEMAEDFLNSIGGGERCEK